MKKLTASLLVLIFIITAFAGCGPAKNVKLSEVLSEINSAYSGSTKGLTELTDVSDLNKYYQIPEDSVKQFAAEINTDSSTAPIEIVLVEPVDSDALESIKTALGNRYNSISSLYASYSAEQYDMVKDCGVFVLGNTYVSLIVAEDCEGILNTINDSIS